MIPADNQDVIILANELICQAGITCPQLSVASIHHGGNNQIFLIDCKEKKYILKKYFKHPNDLLDRLGNEFTFLNALYEYLPNQIPKPYSKIEKKSAALYEYIEGKKLSNSFQVTEKELLQAGKFIANLNNFYKPLLENLISPAHESAFSIKQHLDRIDFRMEKLEAVRLNHSTNSEFNLFFDEIKANWLLIRAEVIEKALQEALNLNEILPQNERVLSPSDFGFHNAIIRPTDEVTFIDFEYAGWDDPAKLVGDFFAQVAIQIPPTFFNQFMQSAFGNFLNFDTINKRASILLKAYKIKWCCITLNIFLPEYLSRKQFVNSAVNIVEFEKMQLNKSRKILNDI